MPENDMGSRKDINDFVSGLDTDLDNDVDTDLGGVLGGDYGRDIVDGGKPIRDLDPDPSLIVHLEGTEPVGIPQFEIFRENPWPEDGYLIDKKLIRNAHECHACIHHMFDGPHSYGYYQFDVPGSELGLVALDVECGKVTLTTGDRRRVDVSGCQGVNEAGGPVYVDAPTSDQQQAMNQLVREALSESDMLLPAPGYQQATITFSTDTTTNTTVVKVTNSTSTVLVSRTINSVGEVHKTVRDCMSDAMRALTEKSSRVPRHK